MNGIWKKVDSGSVEAVNSAISPLLNLTTQDKKFIDGKVFRLFGREI
jgi:hypothetical protein